LQDLSRQNELPDFWGVTDIFCLRMDYGTLCVETVRMKTILKFDTGADGFKKMIVVLAVTAVGLLLLGAYFLTTLHKELQNIS
jgi:hypothetical protein